MIILPTPYQRKWRTWIASTLGILLLSLTIASGQQLWVQNQWFELQRQQLATIKRIGEFPPDGWKEEVWQNALVTPYNVWGNVTYSPDYSQISLEEMRILLGKLKRIVDQTNSKNSRDSVDRVFQLLLERGQKVEFISAYRNEFSGHAD